MKHNAFTALSMAAALVVAGSSGASEFSIDFENYDVGDTMIGETGWTQQSTDMSAVVSTNSSKVLGLDTGDDELLYTPSSTEVSVLTMDVCFVGADEAPATNGFTGQTMVYLDVSDAQNPALKALVGSGWQTISTTVADGSWKTLKMTFDYANDTVKFKVGTEAETTAYNLPATASQTAKVAQVGFKGTGFVDNFVGDKAGIPAQVNGTDVVTATVSGTTVTVDYGSQTGIQFIRVYDSTGAYVTLRTSSASAEINVSKLSGTITRVDAITGANATAIPDDMTSIAATAVTTAVQNGTTNIVVTLPALKSGLYYKLVDATTGATFSNASASKLVAPNEDGDTGETLTVPVSNDPWGVKKFKLVVDDNP